MGEIKIRDYQLDNAKAFLILLVVLGHLLETRLDYGINRELYVLIYIFHMPFFAYITGYFAKADWKKAIRKLLIPYFCFQTIYLLFERFFLFHEVAIQYTKPYWLLWYLLAAFGWNILLWGIQKSKVFQKETWILLAIIVALLCGFIDMIGREWSLSRILVLFPFYLWGNREKNTLNRKIPKKMTVIGSSILLLILSVIMVYFSKEIKVAWLYEASPYQGEYNIFFRGMHLMLAAIFIQGLLLLLPRKAIKGISYIGENTMPTYLMHGFIIQYVGTFTLLTGSVTLFLVFILLPLLLHLLALCKIRFSKSNIEEK